MLKRISESETLDYIPLQFGDPLLCAKAVAFTLSEDPTDPRWEIVTYYTDDSVPAYKLHPLEMMYDEWSSMEEEKESGDEGVS